MNRDILHSLANKAGFGELMSQPQFVDILARYTNLLQQRIQKNDQSIPKSRVCIEIKSITSKGLVKIRRDIDSKVFETMPIELLVDRYGTIAVEFREQLDDPN
jgi:hemerythrin-like domain-containing protein